MARLPKCPECEYQVDKDRQAHAKHSGKTYHEHCFQKFEKRKQDREELYAYICELYGVSVPNPLILRQIKEFQEVNKFTLKGIELALRYFHDIQGNSVLQNDRNKIQGIGIVTWIYEEAKSHYIKMANITKKASESTFESNEEIVYIKQKPRNRKKDYVDIEGILND